MMELEGLTTTELGRNFLWLDEIDSTNDYLKRGIAELPHGTVVAAGFQSAGKGTRQRKWDAKAGSSLMFSALLKSLPAEGLPVLALLAGLAVCQTLRETLACDAKIKWPNDIVASGKKLCGILCESRFLAEGPAAIVGIGLNLTQTAEEFSRLGLLYAASVQSVTGKSPKPLNLAVEILNRFEPILLEFCQNGFSMRLREPYKAQSATLGHTVRFLQNERETVAFVQDINEDGSLLVEVDGSLQRIYAGDISVRGLYDYCDA